MAINKECYQSENRNYRYSIRFVSKKKKKKTKNVFGKDGNFICDDSDMSTRK